MDRKAFEAIKSNTLPKGNVLALAEVAGINAAKNASSNIPLCHPLSLEYAKVWFEFDDENSAVFVGCEAAASAKTGVEMEALAGVNGALLAIYDLTKGVCPALTIYDVRLNSKKGGKKGHWVHPLAESGQTEELAPTTQLDSAEALAGHLAGHVAGPLAGHTVAVLTISDRVSAGKVSDGSGGVLKSFVASQKMQLIDYSVLPDNKEEIVAKLREFTQSSEIDLVLITGGTGLGPRDVTPEAVSEVCDKLIPGIGERARLLGAEHTEFAYLSRAVSGLADNTLVVSFPGSPKAVSQGIAAVKDLLAHALRVVAGSPDLHE